MMKPHEIAHERKALGWTQSRLAAELGRSRVTIWRWETGVTEVPEKLERAARRLFAKENRRRAKSA